MAAAAPSNADESKWFRQRAHRGLFLAEQTSPARVRSRVQRLRNEGYAMAYQQQLDSATQRGADAAHDVVGGATKAAEKLQSDAAAVKRDIASRAADLSDQMADAVKRMGADPAELTNTVNDAWDALEERLRDLVRRRPIRAIVVSAAVGVLLGFVSRG
jgi:ElaB/YqjD/DUF883 family membrane-anchored ribosome-binding protein